MVESVELYGTTDIIITAEVKMFEHFAFNESESTIRGNIAGDGSLVLTVYYNRMVYTVSVSDASIGTVTGLGSYVSGTVEPFEITAYTDRLGYEFIGWYCGEKLFSTDATYMFAVKHDIEARFAVKSEMQNFIFTSTSTDCVVSAVKDKTVTEIIVPNYVTSIGASAFKNCTSLTSVNFSDSVTSIGYEAFSNCTSLTSVIIPDSVTSIGEMAFSGCTSLTDVYYGGTENDWNGISIGSGNEYLTDATIYYFELKGELGGYVLTEYDGTPLVLVIPNKIGDISVVGIESSVFESCLSIVSITIPGSITYVGENAFAFCFKIAEIVNNSAINIEINVEGYPLEHYPIEVHTGESRLVNKDNYLFYTYDNVNYLVAYIGTETELILPESYNGEAYQIFDSAFLACTGLKSVTIPNCVTAIGDFAFYWCSSLESITIPDSVTSIGKYAFIECGSLTSVTIGEGVTSIGDWAFSVCKNLTSISVSENNIAYKDIGGNLYTKDGKTLIQYAVAKTDTSFNIPDGVTTISDRAFAYCYSLTSITIPGNVTSIGDDAFHYCTSLTSVTIPDSVTSIGDAAFSGCYSLTSATIGNSVTSIGDATFSGCDSLTSVTIGNSVTSIGYDAFSGCDSLTSVTIPDSVTSIGYAAFSYCDSLMSVTIGNGVTSIGDNAFYYCTSLMSVTIGNSVTSIGSDAFYACYKLIEVVNNSALDIEKGSSSNGGVGDYAIEVHTGESKIVRKDNYFFYTYDNVNYLFAYIGTDTELILPKNYNGEPYQIYNYAFEGCHSFISVTIPSSVTAIGSGSFSDCKSLWKVYYEGSEYAWEQLDIGSENYYLLWSEISFSDTNASEGLDYKFSTDGEYLTVVGIGSCTDTDIVIPSMYNGFPVREIAASAFEVCTSLTSITIPDSIITIGDYAFYGCRGLTDVTIANGVAVIGSSAFEGCTSLTSITIPDSVTAIGERAFFFCRALMSITVDKNNAAYKDIDGNLYTKDGTTLIQYAVGKTDTSFVIPDGVTTISDRAFYC